MRIQISLVAFVGAAMICQAWAGFAVAQESPQKGQAAGKLEMSRQIQGENADSFEVKALEALRHARKAPLMTPIQSTEAFLRLDRNHDKVLTRSEIPVEMPVLRSRFDKYDINHDHRLTYSEFANYTDVIPDELVGASH